MSNDGMLPAVSWSVHMGRTAPAARSGTDVVSLWMLKEFFPSEMIPPRAVVNSLLRRGVRTGEHGIHVRWNPVELTENQYRMFSDRLTDLGARWIDVPEGSAQSPEDWERWLEGRVYSDRDQVLSCADQAKKARTQHGAELLKRYRRALSRQDHVYASELRSQLDELGIDHR